MNQNLDWHLDEAACLCKGSGWGLLGDVDDIPLVECPVHYEGQLHPDTKILLLDEPDRMMEEERRSLLEYKIAQTKTLIVELGKQLKLEQERLVHYELELINKTPTIKVRKVSLLK